MHACKGEIQVFSEKTVFDHNDLDSCTSLGGINIRMLGFGIQVRIYTCIYKNVYILNWIPNPNILILIPPSEVQESKS
jgi:hypothetical protein